MYVTFYLLGHLLMSLLLINQNVCTFVHSFTPVLQHSKFVVGMLLFYIYIQIMLTLFINVIRRLVDFLTNLNSNLYSFSCQEVYVIHLFYLWFVCWLYYCLLNLVGMFLYSFMLNNWINVIFWLHFQIVWFFICSAVQNFLIFFPLGCQFVTPHFNFYQCKF